MNNIIILLQKESDYSKFNDEFVKNPSAKIFALDYESHIYLEENQIQHKIGDNLLSEDDLLRIDDQTLNFIQNWIPEKFQKKFLLNNIFLPDLIEHELFSYLLTIFTSAIIIKKIVTNEKPSQIIDFTQFNEYTGTLITSNEKIQKIPPNTEKAFYHDKIHVSFSVMKIPINLKISRKTFHNIKKITAKITDKILDADVNQISRKSVLLVNFDPIQYDLLFKELKAKEIDVILYNPRKPAVTNLKSLNIVKNSGAKIFDIYDDEKSLHSEIADNQQEFENILESIFNNREYFENILTSLENGIWDSVKDSLQNICRERINDSVKRILILSKFFQDYDVRLILQWTEVGQEEKECMKVGKNHEIPSFMLQHGRFLTSKKWTKISNFTGHFPHKKISDGQFVWGSLTKEFGKAQGYDNIIISGSPKHDKFFKHKKKNVNSNKILIATTGSMNLSADTSTINSQLKHDKIIMQIYNTLKKIPGKEIIIRTHPSPILTEHIKQLFNQLDSSVSFVNDKDLIEVIEDAELILSFNNSTICLDAIALNKPVISFQTDEWSFDEEIVQQDGVLAVRNISECEIYVKKILFDDGFRESLLQKSQIFLDKYFANQGTSSNYLAKTISESI